MKLLMENWRRYTQTIDEAATLDIPAEEASGGFPEHIKGTVSKSDEDQEAALINALADGLKQEHLTRMIQEELLAELDLTRPGEEIPVRSVPGPQREPNSIYAGTTQWRPERIKSALANLLPGVSAGQDIYRAWSKEELPDADTAERVNRTVAALGGELGEISPLALLFKVAQAQAELRGEPDDPIAKAVGSIGRGPRSGLPGGQARARFELAREWEDERIRDRVAANAAQQREDEYDDVVLADYDDDAADDADYDDDSGDEILRAIVPEGQRNALAGKNQSVSQFSNLVMEKLGFGEGTPADDKWSEKKTHTLEEEDDQK
jgi:hypothetical protein